MDVDGDTILNILYTFVEYFPPIYVHAYEYIHTYIFTYKHSLQNAKQILSNII